MIQRPVQLTDCDETHTISRQNLRRIKMIAIAATLLREEYPAARVQQLLRNRKQCGDDLPVVMLAAHSNDELAAADAFMNGPDADLGHYVVQRQEKHTQTIPNAIVTFQRLVDPEADRFAAKRQTLVLVRRGGKGTPNFVSPFTAGHETTCGKWTRPVVRNPDGSVVKGFMKANVTSGFCPVECPFCYLLMAYTDGMQVALNLEDLATELNRKWMNFEYPINFSETSGIVEYDEWFADEVGNGSIVQSVIDSCAAANVTPFFLTKIRYPRYLKFNGKVQVGISLMPEGVRKEMAPHGSPASELLASLAWSAESGACDPVIRLLVMWQHIDQYPSLLQQCRKLLGRSGWRLTLDILRFTPTTAAVIDRRYPDAAESLAREIDPTGKLSLKESSRETGDAKKLRPPVERQAEIYRWFREQLDQIGCSNVMLTPCKGDPEELLPLVREGIIRANACACYNVTPPLVQLDTSTLA